MLNAVDIIFKTKRRERLTDDEIMWLIDSFVSGSVPDYQMSAWLMAVCFNGLSEEEALSLTRAMRDSGDKLDLSQIEGVTVDKHSTGGIGDKTSLVIAPICAACGLKVPKMSGRGLGFTGGTIDKLESIEGFKVDIPFEKYVETVNRVGAAIIAQSGHLVPADKKMYALRDVTATVDSIPLICSSIMSKKLATGADCILLDVKCGSGAFMKDRESAKKLAELMVKVGRLAGKKCRALITDMDEPLGDCVGNALEVIEACEILRGDKKGRLYDLCMALAANMLSLGGFGSTQECRNMAQKAIESGSALEKFAEMVRAQSGNDKYIYDDSLFAKPEYKTEIKAAETGFIEKINSEEIGMAALMTGAGRRSKTDSIDSTAGIVLCRHVGDEVREGELVMTLYSSSVSELSDAAKRAAGAVRYSARKPLKQPIVTETVSMDS